MKKDRKGHGFTLIELLSVIIITSLIVGIFLYMLINVINTSIKKSYQVTINNIEEIAENYLIENDNKLFFISVDDIEYQCVSIRELIDAGYFKGDILESKVSDERYVKLDDHIYVERNTTTKIVTKKQLLIDDNMALCD